MNRRCRLFPALLSGLLALAAPAEDTIRRGLNPQGLLLLPDGEAVLGTPPSSNWRPVEGWLTWNARQGWRTDRALKGLEMGYLEDEAGSGKPIVLLMNHTTGNTTLAEWDGEVFAPGPSVPEGIVANSLWLGPTGTVFALCAQDGLLLRREGDRWTDHRLLSNLPGIEPQPQRQPGMPARMQRSPRPLRALNPPGRGTWFYQPVSQTNLAACSSFLCLEENAWVKRDPGGEAPFRISAAGCNPQGEVWCAGAGGELARCPPGRATFERVTSPFAPGELVVDLVGLSDGAHWLAKVFPPPSPTSLSRRTCSLRLIAADGTSRPLPSFESPVVVESGRSFHWKSARTEDGDLWLAGGTGPGLVRVNRDGSRAARLSWQQGFPLEDIRSLAIHEGRLLLTGSVGAVIPVPPWDAANPHPASQEWTREEQAGLVLAEPNPVLHLVSWPSGARAVLRMTARASASASQERAILRWDGTAWGKIALPEELKVAEPVAAGDGTLWMVDALRAHVHRDGAWKSYPTLEAALEAESKESDVPGAFTLGGPRAPAHAITGPRGELLYRRGSAIVGFHDGARWQVSGLNLVQRSADLAMSSSANSQYKPEFGSDGTPALRFNLGPDVPSVPFGSEFVWTGGKFEKKEPPRPDPNAIAYLPDNRGLLWQMEQGHWTTGDSATRLRLPGEAAPLPVNRYSLERAHWEPDGTLWLLDKPRQEPLRTTIARRRTLRPDLALSWDAPPPAVHPYGQPLTLTPRRPEEAESWLAWRLDAAPARLIPPGRPAVLALGSLSKGAHRLDVWAMDAGAASGPLLTHRFTVGENQDQMTQRRTQALDDLQSPDPLQRLRAAQRLRGEPGRADVARLRDAAPPDERWWFDNLIREMKD